MTAYNIEASSGASATLGLIVLQVDETLERDVRRCLPDPDLAIYVSRVPSGEDLNPDTIATMKTQLPAAAGLLPKAAAFDAVGYACTSGTTLIGAKRVAELVQNGCQTPAVTDPLTAAIAAFRKLNVRSIGIVSPYIEAVAMPVQRAFEEAGIAVPVAVRFGEEKEANVARIDPRSTADAARDVAQVAGVEAVFLSCTNLRTLDVVPGLEAELGCPVISSNLALCWHLVETARAWQPAAGCGCLFEPA